MTDYSELRAAAEAAPSGDWSRTSEADSHWKRAINVGNTHAAIWCGGESQEAFSIIRFVSSASPCAILALLDEVDALRARGKMPAKRNDYPLEFIDAYQAMERVGTKWRSGSTPAAAFKAWKARTVVGATPAEILAGADKYACYCKAMGCEVKMAQTFFGPGEHFTADWTIPAATGRKGQIHGSIGEQDFNAGIRADGSF